MIFCEEKFQDLARGKKNVSNRFSFYPDGDSYTALGQKMGRNVRSVFWSKNGSVFWTFDRRKKIAQEC